MDFKALIPPRSDLVASMIDSLGEAAMMAPPPAMETDQFRVSSSRPDPEVDRPLRSAVARLSGLQIAVPPGAALKCANIYPAGGGMDWHTDYTQPGWRIYAYVTGARHSGRFFYADQVVTEGIMGAYVFRVGPQCWHAVETDVVRLSCGFEITPEMAETLMG